MAWFNGTYDWTPEQLDTEFPIEIAEGLRVNRDASRIAVINSFEKGSPLYGLADPKAESDENNVFYHPFMQGGDTVRTFIKDFLSSQAAKDPLSILLFRRSEDDLFMYSNGNIVKRLLDSQEELKKLLPKELAKDDVFVLPLRRYMHKCPVCGQRTLQYRDVWDICGECGWEDDVYDDEDCPSPANGDATILEYREEYLRLKTEDPDYKWYLSFEGEDDSEELQEE